MAIIKLGSSKSSTNTINYCEKKAEIKEGLNCNINYAKTQFSITRKLWGKNDGIQVHTIIQSFKPNEITPIKANKIGKKLVEEIAKDYEILIFTHTDKKHIHNHIVINSVNFNNGKKYHSDKKNLYYIKKRSDEICLENGLSIINSFKSPIRYTLAEKSIIEKGQISWKNEIRKAIDFEKFNSNNYNEFKNNLKNKYNIETNDSNKYITFKNTEINKIVKGKTLGENYEKDSIKNIITKNSKKINFV